MNLNKLIEIGERARGEEVYPNPLFPPSIYYRFFKLLAEEVKPKLSVVLGVCGGGDCLHIALGNPQGAVIGVDIAYDHPEQLEYIKSTCPNFRFELGDSVASAKSIYNRFGLVNILFIDTAHEFGLTLSEFNAYKPYLSFGAIVCFDDLFRPGMEDAWDQIPEPKVRMDWLHDGTYPHGGGFGVFINQSNPKIPPTDYEIGN